MRMFGLVKLLTVGLVSSMFLAGCVTNDTELSKDISDAISLARNTKSDYMADQILIKAAGKATTIAEVKALDAWCHDNDAGDQLTVDAGLPLCKKPEDYVSLRSNVDSRNTQDFIILEGIKSCSTLDDYKLLAQHCWFDATRDKILKAGSERLACKIEASGQSISGAVAQSASSGLSDDSAKCPNQDLAKAQEAMLKAQKAYTDAVCKGENSQIVQELNQDFQAKRNAYQALGGQ